MKQNLAFEVFQEKFDHVFFDLIEDQFGIFHQTAGNGLDNRLQHQQVFHFGNVRNIDMLFAQVSYFSFRATVTVNDPFGIQRMEIFQLGESLCRFDYFWATSHRFYLVVGKDKRVEAAVYAVGVGPFDE